MYDSVEPILYVSSQLPKRSETFVYREVFALRALGVDVRVASVRAPERGLGDERLDALADECVEIYGAGVRGIVHDVLAEFVGSPVRTLSTLRLAIRDAFLGRDVSVSRRPRLLVQALAAISLARRVRPLGIVHVHAHFAHVPASIAMYAAQQLGTTFSFTGHAADLFTERTLLARKLRRAAFVACISAWHRDFYGSLAPLPLERSPLVRCGVDVSEFAPSVQAAPSARPRRRRKLAILSVARLVPKKGLDVLVEGVAGLGPAAEGASVTIVGDGPERERLEALVQARGLEERIHFAGALDNDRVRALLAETDLFVLPCRIDASGDRDGIPVALMEAMASGVCVVSGDLPAVRELVEPEVAGVLVPPGDVPALERALERLLADPEERERLAAGGRLRVEEEFSLRENARRLAGALRSVVPGAVPDECADCADSAIATVRRRGARGRRAA